MLSSVSEQLSHFDPITLDAMDRVRLMDRTDTKFVFPLAQLPSILREVVPHYSVLEVAGTRISRYETVYYDTDAHDLYHHHHAGKASRWKIRGRRYVESGICFLEVKQKTNKGRTIKKRVRTVSLNGSLPPEAAGLLRDMTDMDATGLKPRIWVDYGRITLVGKSTAERLTIDVGLTFRTDTQRHDLSKLVIAELKREQVSSGSPALAVLKAQRIKPGSISKYCLGIAATCDGIRSNNFKEKIRLIQRLSHAA